MNKRNYCVLFFLILTSIFLVGCWDKIEINERAFVSVIGIDKYTDNKSEISTEPNKFEVTYVYPNLKAIGKKGQGTPIFTISDVGDNMFEVSKKLTTTSNKTIFLAHTKAIVLGEELVRQPVILQKILDGMSRDPDIGRKANVLVAQGKAKDLLQVEAEVEPMLGVYISELLKAKERGGRFFPITIGDLLQKLHNNGTAIMPFVKPYKNKLKIDGSAVLREYRYIGYLDNYENENLMILLNELKLDEISFNYNGINVPYIITNSKCSKSVEKNKEDLTIKFDVNIEGYIEQYKLETEEKMLQSDLVKDMEKEVELEIKEQLLKIIKKIQKEYNADILGIGEYLSKYEPEIWEDYKKDWDKKFRNIMIKIEVDAKIRRIGMIK